ncbi:MAG: 3-oxoacyl-ACP reductase FabG [Pseudomonadales bacterium]|jgi:3-oxoacyl-[acyl-carrier protein] reductase|nr:3-oxoacyl-ACP reductase FabG [Pseudomonadales bacterium]
MTDAPAASAPVALVTGASRGIGAAIADALAAAGYRIAGTATTDAGASAISERLGAAGRGFVLDVSDDASVDAGLEAVTAALGAPEVVVNNAGITRDNLLLRMKPEEWSAVLETNVGGLYRLCRRVLRPMMKARKGRIVNVSSVIARMGNAGQSNYAASKAAMEGFTRSLAQEVGSRGITVNAVAPGFIETEMTDGIAEAQREQLLARVPLGRLGSPAEVAAVVVFLASDAAAYVTGETLHVNGGMYMG